MTAARVSQELIDIEQGISENVAALLHRSRMSGSALAREVGMSVQTLSRKMQVGPWHYSEVVRIARFMNVSTDELAGDLPSRAEWEARGGTMPTQGPVGGGSMLVLVGDKESGVRLKGFEPLAFCFVALPPVLRLVQGLPGAPVRVEGSRDSAVNRELTLVGSAA